MRSRRNRSATRSAGWSRSARAGTNGSRSSAAASGVELLADPTLAVALVARAVVQPVVAVLPELPGVRRQPESAPVRRTGRCSRRDELLHRVLELPPRFEHGTLS